jgi:hypothetical protein
MSHHDYIKALDLNAGILEDIPTFATLIMAACYKADPDNLELLKKAFPVLWGEFQARFHSLGGFLPGESAQADALVEEQRQLRIARSSWLEDHEQQKAGH